MVNLMSDLLIGSGVFPVTSEGSEEGRPVHIISWACVTGQTSGKTRADKQGGGTSHDEGMGVTDRAVLRGYDDWRNSSIACVTSPGSVRKM
jgi:hypothetical protein